MRFRTLALALALACGFTTLSEAAKKPTAKHTFKPPKVKSGKIKANKVNRHKVQKHVVTKRKLKH